MALSPVFRLSAVMGLLILFVPTLAGSVLVGLNAFEGDGGAFTLEHFQRAFLMPGFLTSLFLGLWTGVAATLFSVVVTFLFFAAFAGSHWINVLAYSIKPLLAVPHAAAAFGMLFLVAPSGIIVRVMAPFIGLDRPPDLLLVNDPWGLSLAAGMALKEVPFIALIILAALPQVEKRHLLVARTLGFGSIWGWLIAVGPPIYKQARLPILALLAYATSSIDMALILGPGTPPTLAVQILRWVNDPDLSLRYAASAAALMQLLVTGFAICMWLCAEKIVAAIAKGQLTRGWRGIGLDRLKSPTWLILFWTIAFVFLGLFIVALWSVAGRWPFPNLLPSGMTFSNWMRQSANILDLTGRTFFIAAMSATLALALAIACLENEFRVKKPLSNAGWIAIYLPLLLPQIVFVTGLSQFFLWIAFDANIFAVVLVHLIFVFPYVYITLAAAWNRFDARYLAIANTLSKDPDHAFWHVRLPMLTTPILVALALGFSVSVAQYLPTLLIGAGRTPTLTTEAIALSAGGNRRLIGIYALMQALLPFIVFAMATIIPAIMFANRKAMKAEFLSDV